MNVLRCFAPFFFFFALENRQIPSFTYSRIRISWLRLKNYSHLDWDVSRCLKEKERESMWRFNILISTFVRGNTKQLIESVAALSNRVERDGASDKYVEPSQNSHTITK